MSALSPAIEHAMPPPPVTCEIQRKAGKKIIKAIRVGLQYLTAQLGKTNYIQFPDLVKKRRRVKTPNAQRQEF